ncbi:MAG: FkbM family methyltransferase [Acidimicrobiales bacterium]
MSSRRRVLADRVDRLNKAVDVLLLSGSARALTRCRPLSLAGLRITGAIQAEGIEPDTILDIGANRGQFSAAALHRFPRASVTAFEPLPGPAAALRRLPLHAVHEIVLGAVEKVVAFRPQAYDLSSSVLPMHGGDGPVVELRQQRLDQVVALEDLRGVVLMKLDVQGYELEVLAGAGELLGAAFAIVIEQAFEQAYEGQPSFDQVHGELVRLGFALARIVDLRRAGGRIVEIDSLYTRTASEGVRA